MSCSAVDVIIEFVDNEFSRFFSEFISSSDLQMLLVAGLFFNHWYILLEFAEAELCSLLAFENNCNLQLR